MEKKKTSIRIAQESRKKNNETGYFTGYITVLNGMSAFALAARKDVPEKSPQPGKCPGACKAIRDEKQHVFHHEGVISRIDPPGGEKLQIHGTVPAAILSGEKSNHQYDHKVQRKHHETCHYLK